VNAAFGRAPTEARQLSGRVGRPRPGRPRPGG